MKYIRDYIYKDISSISESSSLRKVVKTMRLHRICAIPVVDHLGQFLGVISEKEILHAAIPDYMKSISNTSFMANFDQVINNLKDILDERAEMFIDRDFPIVKPDDTLSFAADLLYRTNHNTLPVVENGIFQGFVSRIDIISGALNGHQKK